MNNLLTQPILPLFNNWYLDEYLALPNIESTADIKLRMFWNKPFDEKSGVIKHFFFANGIDMNIDNDTQVKSKKRSFVYPVGEPYNSKKNWMSKRCDNEQEAIKHAFKRACLLLRESPEPIEDYDEPMYSESQMIDMVNRYFEELNQMHSTNDPVVQPIKKTFKEWLWE